MLEVAQKRVDQLRDNGFPQAGIYDPPGVGGTGVVTVLAYADQPELYGLPRNPTIPLAVRLWKGPLKTLGNMAMLRRRDCGGRPLHPLRTQAAPQGGRRTLSTLCTP